MKSYQNILLIAIIFFVAFSCAIQRDRAQIAKGRLELKEQKEKGDSTEYDLVVFDQGFDFWLNSRSINKGMYTNEYLQTMNNLYAQEWNRRYTTGDRRIESYIDYNPLTNYGFEFNYKLFMFFKYFEETNRVKLAPYSSR